MNKINLYVITGASKGLGASLAIESANSNSSLILISRNKEQLKLVETVCKEKGANVYSIFKDISEESFRSEFVDIYANLDFSNIDKIYLINNASIIDPISSIFNLNWTEQNSVININLTSSIWLSSEFLRLSKRYIPSETVIINISSGVSLKPINGWSLYCISKAGINMLTSCIAQETEFWKNNVYALAINPGALNTDMQKSIREADVEEAPIASKFKQMYNDGLLKNPSIVAKKILEIVQIKEMKNGSFVDFNLM